MDKWTNGWISRPKDGQSFFKLPACSVAKSYFPYHHTRLDYGDDSIEDHWVSRLWKSQGWPLSAVQRKRLAADLRTRKAKHDREQIYRDSGKRQQAKSMNDSFKGPI